MTDTSLKSVTDPLPTRSKLDNSSTEVSVQKPNRYGKLSRSPAQPVPQKHISSSTSTLKTDGDIGMTKPSTLLRSVCLLLRFHIEQGHTVENPKLLSLFSEVTNPLV